MPKNHDFAKSMKKFRDNLRSLAQKEVEIAGQSVKEDICYTIMQLAQDRLLQYSEASPESESLVESIADNIYVDDESGEVRVKSDPEGLLLFLEYGTGLVGRDNNTTEGLADADKVGWKYATKFGVLGHYKKVKDRYGWIFERDSEHYLGKDDWVIPKETKFHQTDREKVRFYFRTRNGKREFVKSYSRKRPHGPTARIKDKNGNPVYKNLVFTAGIKPIRFMYEARKKVKDLIAHSEGLTVSEFRKELNILTVD